MDNFTFIVQYVFVRGTDYSMISQLNELYFSIN